MSYLWIFTGGQIRIFENSELKEHAQNGLPETVKSDGSVFLSRTFSGHGETDSETYTVGSQNVFRNRIDTRGKTGRILTKTETVGGTDTAYVYSYDDMDRLLTVTKNSAPVEEYHYDAAGTRTYDRNTLRNITRNSITYRADDGFLNTGASYQHDADGFLTTKTAGSDVTAYDYSSRGRAAEGYSASGNAAAECD